MNIVVCVKHVPDTEARVQIAGDSKSIETEDINFILNPFDEFAVEQALLTREKLGGEVGVEAPLGVLCLDERYLRRWVPRYPTYFKEGRWVLVKGVEAETPERGC